MKRTHIVTTTEDSGEGSLRDAIARAIDGDAIAFNLTTHGGMGVIASGDFVTSGKRIIKLTSGEIKFDKILSIDGGKKIILDGCNASRIFNCCNSDLTLKGLELKNGCGAVLATGNVFATDCGFYGNFAKDSGGAMYANGNIFVKKCAFDGNKAKCAGGALSCRNGHIAIVSCAFINNAALDGRGGAVCAKKVSANGSSFMRNTARHSGGAVNAEGSFVAKRCEFTGNHADSCGGAVDARQSFVGECCEFTDNHAEKDGGAVNVGCGGATMLRCSFEGNRSNKSSSGSAVDAFSSFMSASSCISAKRCAFKCDDSARENGVMLRARNIAADHCSFSGKDLAGAVLFNGKTVSATRCAFKND
jgi:hypothetical protein